MSKQRAALIIVVSTLLAFAGGWIIGAYTPPSGSPERHGLERPYRPISTRRVDRPDAIRQPRGVEVRQPVEGISRFADAIPRANSSGDSTAPPRPRRSGGTCGRGSSRTGLNPSAVREPEQTSNAPRVTIGLREGRIEQDDDSGETASSVQPAQGDTASYHAIQPPPVGASFTQGPEDAPITIFFFGDFLCPYSRTAMQTVREMTTRYPRQIRLVFKSFPVHTEARSLHRAALAAGEQGKFWEYHDLLFENQRSHSRHALEQMASQLGLDLDRFRADLDSERIGNQVEREMQEGRAIGVLATPTFVIGDEYFLGTSPVRFEAAIERHLPR